MMGEMASQLKALILGTIEAIDMAAYGAMDGAKVIRRVKEVLGD